VDDDRPDLPEEMPHFLPWHIIPCCRGGAAWEVVLDEDGRFYVNANSLGVMEHKPSKETVDRLFADTRKREAEKEAKRRKKRAGEDGDVWYINKRKKV